MVAPRCCRYTDTTTTYLYNISADPTESTNLATTYPKVVRHLTNLVAALVPGSGNVTDPTYDYIAPCNVPGGACSADDPNAAAVLQAHSAWYPWVTSTSTATRAKGKALVEEAA
jgi:hypothetical protein